ncbi:hypothetical protein V500_10472 [Pseudogymnoascus sp. VKM F-4518 (FW-2643)]|nr:hypothetical protein V500_10472 [Pseudogymnoascus sp. VKM F-4518 (FW-2643)]
MKALVYRSVGNIGLEERPKPQVSQPTDAIVKLSKSTICGTDLHIIKGDVATCTPGTILGHEGVGIIEEVGASVRGLREGWILGNSIDGTQAEYVRIPHADSSLYPVPKGANEDALVLLSDIFPTGLECGVLNGKTQPGSTVVIVGAGPVGLAAMITSQLYSPSIVIMIDMDENRLKVAESLGAHHTINPSDGKAVEAVKALTDQKGCDVVIEAVGIPQTFELCQNLVAPGGIIANVGVHGTKVDLHLENLWAQNIAITTRLVDTVTTPMLLKLVSAGRIDPSSLITHRFAFADIEAAYTTFSAASEHKALKVLIDF